MTGPQRIRTKLSGGTAAIHQPAKWVPSAWRKNPPSVKSLQPGNSIPVILVVERNVGSMDNVFRLGQPKGGGPELVRTENQIRVGPRRTLGNHHLNSAIYEFSEIQKKPWLVFRTLKAVTKASNDPDTKMPSLSLANGNF